MKMTTITIKDMTKRRLADYKYGEHTYDDVLNLLMDHVSIEDVTTGHIREHYRRLKTFQGVPKEEFKRKARSRKG